jgi:HD-like signal output (HDOD) protein
VLHYGKGIEIVVQATNLPLSPVHAKKLVTLIEEEGSREEMQALLLADPALSAKLLQLSNGAFFGSKHSCNNSHDALIHIGLPMFAAFLKENGLLNTDEFHTLQFDWDWYYSISQTAATLAAHLAEQVGIDESIQRAIYTAGLFHRLGVLLLAYTKPEQFAASCNQTTETRVLDQSDGCFDIPQLQLSSKLLSLWGVPELITGTLSRINSPDSLLFDRNSLDPYLYLGASLAQQHCSATSQLFEIPFCSESVKRCSAVLGIETDTVNALCKEALDG